MTQTMTKLALAAAALLPIFAHAQSQVSLYGVVDLGLNRTSNVNGKSVTDMRSGNSLTSRWGIRGSEDLGGGMKASFRLESGINADTGAASSNTNYFNRQSWMGLSKQGLGEVRMGRQLTVMNDVFGLSNVSTYLGTQAAALDGSAPAGSSAGPYDNMVGGTRLNSMLKLSSAKVAGFQVSASVILEEQLDDRRGGRTKSLGVAYDNKQWEAGLVYQLRDGNAAVNSHDEKIWGVGAAYKFAQTGRIAAFATQQKNAKNVAGNDANVYSLLLIYPVQQWSLIAGYQKLDDKSVRDQDVNQLNLGVKYALSKRTDVYGIFSKQKVGNGGAAGMFSQLSSTNKQNQINVGVRHSF